ncbi:Response regulator of zinc sigma-54-dependent two-component system [Labilithrix luteola]|uniref:Response regulator of zinc sigma-54-dependent two-component system n=1 Tax=Labilithrix luteola TaxID=1391654 RepID=A0A0K1PW15_9BACT|nr:sigma-54 dependent transcriptional regulator [Labilithrix luteola]AKU97334.1 Response regulator of zinc sigma-54-dependent two-component system [Labilithrix luteola]
MQSSVLVVEDDAAVGLVLTTLLQQSRFEAVRVPSGEAALEILQSRPFDVVISDIRMPGMDGLALLAELGKRFPDLPVILLTAHGSVPLAVEAMKAGAVDFMLKPFERDEILFVVEKALARGRRAAEKAPSIETGSSGFVGSSPAMNDVLTTIRKVASGTATVLVRGETGTGKELVARALHESGTRKDHPFVRVHCAALPDSLLESELFGYEKGAFTGAATRKPGRVELAHRGTLFLDEIGDVTPQVQVKLLRVLQEREFERVGGTETIKVDVRFVAATHRDLEAMVKRGEFREDLFYRLNVVPVRVPALRERGGDVESIALHFARVFGEANGKPGITVEPGALHALRSHAWPGNVRQLQNLMERLVVLTDGLVIRGNDVERELGGASPSASSPSGAASSLGAHRQEAEKEALLKALARANNNRTLAARLLDVSRRTLYNKLREHGIE